MPKVQKPVSEVVDVTCPKCTCDWMMPLMKIRNIRSFAGNKIQIEWPSRDGDNECVMLACPSCWEIIRVTAGGSIQALDKKLSGK